MARELTTYQGFTIEVNSTGYSADVTVLAADGRKIGIERGHRGPYEAEAAGRRIVRKWIKRHG